MPVSEVHHVAIIVSEIERSAEFYERALGYRPTLQAEIGGESLERSLRLPAGTTGRVQYLQGPTQIGQIELIEWDGATGDQARTGHDALGTFLLSFQVPADEIDELYERLCELGADCLTEPSPKLLDNYGWINGFAATDPDGNLMEFVALPSREEIKAFREQKAREA